MIDLSILDQDQTAVNLAGAEFLDALDVQREANQAVMDKTRAYNGAAEKLVSDREAKIEEIKATFPDPPITPLVVVG